ncbi:MAG: hypothetical protein WB441_00760 [Nocardioidaceae bacterium]
MRARALFWEADLARVVAERLRSSGFEAVLGRDRFAGEDDDEDQPWSVLTDAPEVMLELLVDEHDGWLDDGPGTSSVPAVEPLELPQAPRRVKGHFPEP